METTRTAEDLDEPGSRPRFAMPAGLRPKVLSDRAECWYEQLVIDDAPPSAMKFFRYLDRHGRYRTGGEMHRYAFGSAKKIAKEYEVAEPSIRTYAVPWLVANGYLAVERVEVGGRKLTLWWCLWLLPLDLATGGVDPGLGIGVVPARVAPRRPRRQPDRTRRRAVFEAHGAENGRPKSAPTNPDGLEERNGETTTDRADAGVVVVSPAAPRGEILPTEPPPAPPPLAPELAELLEREIPPAGRPGLAARAAQWCLVHPVERVVKAIARGVEAAKARAIRRSLIGYIAGVLANLEREGIVEVIPAPARPATTNAPSPAEADAVRSARREYPDPAARGAQLAAALAALPAPDREALEAEYARDNPPPPGKARKLWEIGRQQWCVAAVGARKSPPPASVESSPEGGHL